MRFLPKKPQETIFSEFFFYQIPALKDRSEEHAFLNKEIDLFLKNGGKIQKLQDQKVNLMKIIGSHYGTYEPIFVQNSLPAWKPIRVIRNGNKRHSGNILDGSNSEDDSSAE